MSMQSRSNIDNRAFILSGMTFVKEAETIIQDAGRTAVLKFGTLMAKIAASGKWTPFINEAATNGTAHPQGIYVGDELTAAKIVAGDVLNCPILVGGVCTIDSGQLTIEASKTLATVITVGTTDLRTVEDHLQTKGIFVESTVDAAGIEN